MRLHGNFPLQPRQVEAFHSVVQLGSMTAAAKALGVTQPAVSRLIRDFEHAVGVALFQRQGAQLIPTAEALFLMTEVERCFIGLDEIARAAADIANLRTGRLHIAGTPTISARYLAKVITQMVKLHPNVSITVQSLQSLHICEMVARNQVDIGVGVSPREHPGIVWEPLPKMEVVCALPSNHRLAWKTSVTPEDLENEQIIVKSGASQLRKRFESVTKRKKKPVRPLIECSLASTICAMVAQGAGVAMVDPFTANDFDGAGIVQLPFSPTIPYRSAIAYPVHRPRANLAEEFSRLLVKSIAQDFGPFDG